MKEFLKKQLSQSTITKLKTCYFLQRNWFQRLMYPYGRFVKTPLKINKNSKKTDRWLEIGPGSKRIPGFETLNIVWDWHVDYVADASGKLPFPDSIFDLVYASHILEHIPWYQVQDVLNEWVRLLKPGGRIEIWVPDAYKICKLLVDIENDKDRPEWHDGWRPFNDEDDPYKWVSGRLLYGAKREYPSWHLSLITPNYLKNLFEASGLIENRALGQTEYRGYVDHGWINLGMTGTKP